MRTLLALPSKKMDSTFSALKGAPVALFAGASVALSGAMSNELQLRRQAKAAAVASSCAASRASGLMGALPLPAGACSCCSRRRAAGLGGASAVSGRYSTDSIVPPRSVTAAVTRSLRVNMQSSQGVNAPYTMFTGLTNQCRQLGDKLCV